MRKKKYVKRVNAVQYDLWKNKTLLLRRLDVELTERCNNSCIHCCINLPLDDQRAKKRELSTDQVKNILEQATSLGCLSVRFTGGEPLIRDDFMDLYVFSRGLGLKVILFTNATLLTPELVDLFKRIPPMEKIEITLYGMNEKTYEAVSKMPGSFDAAWRGINLLLVKEVPFVVKYAILPQNREDVEDFETWSKKVPWMEKSPVYSMLFDLRYRHDNIKKNNLVRRLRSSPEESLEFLIQKNLKFENDMKEFCSRFMYPAGKKIFSCGAGYGYGCVDAYGFFSPCLLIKDPHIQYDLKKGSLKHAMMNYFPEIRKTDSKNPYYLERCARCFLKGLCEQCPAKSWTEHGNLDTPVEYHCKITHLKAVHLGLIKEGEKAWEVKKWRERIHRFTGKDIISKNIKQEEEFSCEN